MDMESRLAARVAALELVCGVLFAHLLRQSPGAREVLTELLASIVVGDHSKVPPDQVEISDQTRALGEALVLRIASMSFTDPDRSVQ